MLSIIGCLLLLLLSNCSTATDWGGDTYRRICTPSVAMLTAEGFCFLGAVVNEDGTVNHTQSIFSVYPRRDPYPHSNAQGYAVRRHDDAVLRGAVGAEDDGARVVHNSTATKNTSLQSVRDMMVIAIP